mmetsp:Transcript_1018/g.2447  ORF Transcript_1018/g.2447 Transcript_1018/m.2447 type:complete len:288 (-) Transcript_1018:17-880(-)
MARVMRTTRKALKDFSSRPDTSKYSPTMSRMDVTTRTESKMFQRQSSLEKKVVPAANNRSSSSMRYHKLRTSCVILSSMEMKPCFAKCSVSMPTSMTLAMIMTPAHTSNQLLVTVLLRVSLMQPMLHSSLGGSSSSSSSSLSAAASVPITLCLLVGMRLLLCSSREPSKTPLIFDCLEPRPPMLPLRFRPPLDLLRWLWRLLSSSSGSSRPLSSPLGAGRNEEALCPSPGGNAKETRLCLSASWPFVRNAEEPLPFSSVLLRRNRVSSMLFITLCCEIRCWDSISNS